MPRTHSFPRHPANRIGAYGFTLLLGLGGLNFIGGGAPSATATATASRLNPPAAAAPAARTVANTVIDLTNQARAAAGLAPVVEDSRPALTLTAGASDAPVTRSLRLYLPTA